MCSRGHLEAAAAGLKEDVRPRPPAPQPRAAPGTGTVLEPGAGPARPPGCSRLSLPDTPPPPVNSRPPALPLQPRRQPEEAAGQAPRMGGPVGEAPGASLKAGSERQALGKAPLKTKQLVSLG